MEVTELERKNPWLELAKKVEQNSYHLLPENVLEADKKVIDNFNQKQPDVFQYKTSMMPAHFTGNILKSNVVLLATNPGYVEEEVENFYCNPKFIEERIMDLTFQNDRFISDDEERINESPYWNKKVRWLIDEVGFKNVSENISLLQFNPYHSTKFRKITKTCFRDTDLNNYLRSQYYGFELLRNCIEQGKLIVVLRSKNDWFTAVPELYEHERNGQVITIKNKRQPFLSPKNFETTDDFYRLVNTLDI